jgi:hypothetical protein
MTIAPHDRTLYHLGQEDTTTLTLSAQIGRYPAGMTAQAVLTDMAARLAALEAAGCGLIVNAFTVDAVVYGPRSFTLDAVISAPIHTFSVDASIHGTVATSFTVNAYLVDHVGGQTTLASPVSSGASSIVVTSTSTFPFTTPFTIVIDGTTYTVTSGGGGTTWSISPNAAANYSSGTAVNEVC